MSKSVERREAIMAGKSPLDIKPGAGTEMAEWLAVDVLGWHLNEYGNWADASGEIQAVDNSRCEGLEEFLAKPAGFFVVKNRIFTIGYQFYRVWPIWDEQGEGLQVGIGEDYTTAKVYTGNYYYPKTGNDKEDLDNTKAEIEAFYNAVYEAMKESK